MNTPASLGYRMPGEWHEHEATWLAWPTNQVSWPGAYLVRVEEIYLEIIAILLAGEKVHLLVNDEKTRDMVTTLLKSRGANLKNLLPHVIATVDSWTRDYGPTFLLNGQGEKAWCKWTFNAWGNKYRSHLDDNSIFESAASLIAHPCFKAGIVLEGGSIESNGEGTLIVTEQCLLNKNRNPRLNRNEIEKILSDYLGVSQIIWLEKGLVGDETDGHVDNVTRFVAPETILSVYESDESDENFRSLDENWKRLAGSQTSSGKSWNLIKLPTPGFLRGDAARKRLTASYANFYIANQVVLLPVYGHTNDERAIKILEEVFPKRRIVPILTHALTYGGGSIHCVTQQEPK